MGSVPSPEVCDILMFDILEEINNRFQFKHKIYYSGRYRDDGFMIFHSNEEEIKQLFNIANNFHQFIKFTFNILKSHTDFLDIHIFKGNRFAESGKLDMKTYFKSINSFVYLQRNSCHSKHVFSGFIKGEAIRHIRNTNNGDDLHDIISNFRKRLIDRGYRESEIGIGAFSEISLFVL